MGERLFSDEQGRICSRCNEYKTWDSFSNNAGGQNNKRPDCKACRKLVESDYVRVYNKESTKKWRTKLQNLPFDQLTHGKYSTYAAGKCRCDECMLAYANYLINLGNSLIVKLESK